MEQERKEQRISRILWLKEGVIYKGNDCFEPEDTFASYSGLIWNIRHVCVKTWSILEQNSHVTRTPALDPYFHGKKFDDDGNLWSPFDRRSWCCRFQQGLNMWYIHSWKSFNHLSEFLLLYKLKKRRKYVRRKLIFAMIHPVDHISLHAMGNKSESPTWIQNICWKRPKTTFI